MRPRSGLLLVCTVLLASAAQSSETKSVVYSCEEGSRIYVTFVNQAAALRDPAGLIVTLSQRRSGSGFLYEGQGQSLRGKGDAVSWKPAGGEPVACHAVAAAAPAGLAGTSWQLEAIGATTPADPASYTIAFQADGRVAVRLDCNRAAGAWKSDVTGVLGFGPMAMTRAACVAGSLDTQVAAALAKVRTYGLEDGRLIMRLDGDADSLVWRRMP